MTNAEFLRAAVLAAEDAVRAGAPIQPHAAAAHAANESGYGKSGLAVNARNLFGVKATGQHTPYWSGDSVTMPTWEVVDGKRVDIRAAFRQYASWADSFSDYGDIIARVYPHARADDPNGFLAGLFLTGPRKWATDPHAFDKCARILGIHNRVINPPDEGTTGTIDTLVLHEFFDSVKEPIILRSEFATRQRQGKLDVRRVR